MFNLLSIVLAGAAAAAPAVTPVAAEQPEVRITLSARPFFPGNKPASSFTQRFTLASSPATWYVFTGKTICESQTVSAERPAFAGNGWRVDLKPAAPGSKSIQVTWERLWVGGKPASGGGTRAMTLGSGTPLVLDSIDGSGRLQRQQVIEKLKAISPTDLAALSAIPELEDGETSSLRNQIATLEKTRKELTEVSGLGRMNIRVVQVDTDLSLTKKRLADALAERLPGLIAVVQDNTNLPAVDGCDALSMNLQITAESAVLAEPTETEIWLVHKDPAGVETVQRQVVRMAATNGSYVFDDIVVKTDKGPITIEVYGSIETRTGADAWIVLGVNRRYVASGSGFTWKTKEGGTNFNQALRPDEVVAFNLLPLKDDEGVLVGHRFSVRVRTKILK